MLKFESQDSHDSSNPTQADLISDVLEGVLHVEEHLEGVGDDSRLLHGAPHRVGLAATRLAVREDRHVVAVHYRLKLFGFFFREIGTEIDFQNHE